eukprot:scaffold54141_cov30-Phaeocystis_antarctica.AAC.1
MVLHGWRWRSENYGVTPAPSVDPLMHNGRACTSLTMTLTLPQIPNPKPIPNPTPNPYPNQTSLHHARLHRHL